MAGALVTNAITLMRPLVKPALAAIAPHAGRFAYDTLIGAKKRQAEAERLAEIENTISVGLDNDRVKFTNNNETFTLEKEEVARLMDGELFERILIKFARLLIDRKAPDYSEIMKAVAKAKLLV